MYLFVQSGSMLIRSLLPESCAIAAFETIEEMRRDCGNVTRVDGILGLVLLRVIWIHTVTIQVLKLPLQVFLKKLLFS